MAKSVFQDGGGGGVVPDRPEQAPCPGRPPGGDYTAVAEGAAESTAANPASRTAWRITPSDPLDHSCNAV